jgi:ATP-binding protein involved in chromosome partitioning
MSEPKKLPILSLKGGTGKTTTCIDIAYDLQQRNYKVGLLDVDIHASALPRALGMKVDPGYDALLGGRLRPIDFDGFQVFSIGLLFPEETPNMWDGETKASAVQQIATTSIAWREDLEWVVVDTPPTSGDEVQSLLKNMGNIYGAVIICQPNDLAVLALVKTLNVLQETETPIAGVLANMSGYTCPRCGFVSNPFDRSSSDVRALAEGFRVHFLGSVPFGARQARWPVIDEAVDFILRSKPTVISKKKGGLTRWILEKGLQSLSL